MHEPNLITTIVLSLVLAFAGGFAARKIGLPPLSGYLLAGIALGPFTPGFVGDKALTSELADIGIILLMFGVGLHFSAKDLFAVRRIAIPTAVAQLVVATALGAALAYVWHWRLESGLVFGLALSVASTVVALRALETRNTLDSVNGQITVGTLIVQDLAMVLVLVLLPAFEAGALHSGGSALIKNLATTIVKIGAFVALMLLVGKRVIPWILEHVARTGSRELFTLSVLATALGIAYGSSELFGVSFALGAFFAGVVLSETDFSYQAAADSLPLQDAFAVLFFVSIGMLFDPFVIVRDPLAVFAVFAAVVVLKSLAAFATVLLLGYPASSALAVTASLAQIGEFSFILAGLSVTQGILPAEGRDLILAAALLSITLNPLVFATAKSIERWLQQKPELLLTLERIHHQDDLSALPETATETATAAHAVIVGYGRVGGVVGRGLKAQGIPIVVVEQDRRRVEALRARGVQAVYGDASTLGVLRAARTDLARVLVIGVPEGFQTRRIIQLARALNPKIFIAVRTHSERELTYLEQQGIGMAIMGERELAFGLLDYALRQMGTDEDKARLVIQNLRISGDGGAFERRAEEPPTRAPELRPHRDESSGTIT
jgi:CPA2 family monovalent cation:H+ antiporter-2